MTSLLDHGHGVANTRCSHPECREASARYRKRWELDRLEGRPRLDDAEAARLHIATLQGRGWSLRAISGAAGLGPGVVHHLAKGQRKAHPHIVAKILAVDPETLPVRPSAQTTEPFVPRVGVVRRIQALMTLGWTHEAMSEHAGLKTANLLSQQGRWVTRSTHDKVAAMYRALCTKPGPSERTRARALKRGFYGPLDWDDIDHDPEPETGEADGAKHDVDEVLVQRVSEGDWSAARAATHAERRHIVARFREDGRPLRPLELHAGWKPERYRDAEAVA